MNPNGVDAAVADSNAARACAPAPTRPSQDVVAADREFRERELRNVNDHLPALIGQFDAAIHFRYLNAYYRRLLGDAAKDAVGKTVAEVLGDEIYRKRRPYLDRALAGEIVRFEAELSSISGPCILSHVYTPEVDEQGKVCGIYVFAIDVTEQREAQRRLALSQAELHLVNDSVPALIAHYDRECRYLYINRTYREAVGDAAGNLIGRPLREV